MFKHSFDSSPLRLVDFGCACFLSEEAQSNGYCHGNEMGDDGLYATLFAGTPFYVAPEVFDRKYSYPADIWSIGVIMCVVMAGYPAEDVEEAFTLMR